MVIISDKYGRLSSAKVSLTLKILAGVGQIFSPNIYFYFIARFFIGFAMYGTYLNGYVLIAEWVGPKIRGKMAVMPDTGYCIGDLVLPWIFYHIPNYYKIESNVVTIQFFLSIGYVFVVKVSPRLQLIHGKYEEAEETLRKAAREKGLYSVDEINRRIKKLEKFMRKEQEFIEKQRLDQNSIFAFWKDKNILKTTLILYFSWFSFGLVAFRSFFNVQNLGGSLHFNSFTTSISRAISVALLYFVIQRFDRRSLMRTVMISKAAVFLLLLRCTFNDVLLLPRILFHNISSIAGWLDYAIIYIYSTEFFPTTLRQRSIGICSVFARIGSMIAPFILTHTPHLTVP
jgi:OCT family organic cation transporter-like MFS transporter 4/5